MKTMDQKEFARENVFGLGAENTAYAKYFIGQSYLNPLTRPESGLFLANVTFEPGCRNNWHMAYAPLGQGRKNEMFENPDLVQIAKTHGKTAAQIALRYLMQSGVIVIPKSVHTERIKENFELFDFALTAGEMERLANMDTATPMIGNSENPAMVEAAMKW